jgi:uncharacterized protein YodC (DUF2158 family)
METGDIVKLKSGGPEMVLLYNCTNMKGYICGWFDVNENYCEAAFPIYALVKINSSRKVGY